MMSGRLNKKISIQDSVEVQSGTGEVTKTWTSLVTVWASITPLIGAELYKLKSVDAKISTKVRIRHVTGISTKMRILYGSEVLNIISIIDIREGNKEIVLMCEQIL